MTKFEKKTPEPTDNAAPATTETNKAKSRVAPIFTPVSSSVPMPVRFNNRGSKSAYDFSALEVGQSFGIKNKTAKSCASLVSNANKKHRLSKIDDEGKPTTVQLKSFFIVDCDPSTDPDGASVRIFRSA